MTDSATLLLLLLYSVPCLFFQHFRRVGWKGRKIEGTEKASAFYFTTATMITFEMDLKCNCNENDSDPDCQSQ